ncbi:hypothetical protein [Arthrobacter sp. 260]|uniref:hypothetical protein n=1 Tax=Arthrobacter sp. 260 TaxID=2735314 RepID=UPI0014924AC2|nr:hypothetical protein [Arthrobacter sp. 260]NOJ61020.1 hypothetical protein [Arthrobacter sp. 260]
MSVSNTLTWFGVALLGVFILVPLIYRLRHPDLKPTAATDRKMDRLIWVQIVFILIVLTTAVILRENGL